MNLPFVFSLIMHIQARGCALHKTKFQKKKTVFCGTISWSEMGKQNLQAKNVYLLIFFAAFAEVQVTVLSVLNLPRQGFPATCQIGHPYVCSPLLFASEILCDSPTYNKQWDQGAGRVAWKPKMQDDVMLNGVFRICLWFVARQLWIPNR